MINYEKFKSITGQGDSNCQPFIDFVKKKSPNRIEVKKRVTRMHFVFLY